jgi:hypothetical protein
MPSSRVAHRISLFFGLVILALTVFSVSQPAPAACGGLPRAYAPIIAFELARSVGDLHAIFGAAPGPCRSAIAHRVDATNTVDSWIFIPVYGLFLLFFFLGRRRKNAPIANAAILLVFLACGTDYVENDALFHLSANPDSAAWIPPLVWATETKWNSLGIAGFSAVPLLWRTWLAWPALFLCGAGLIATLATIAASAVVGPYLSNAIALGWLVILVADFREAARRASSHT